MTHPTSNRRTDAASLVIKASPQTIYRAFVDPAAVASWLPPAGMTGEVHHFDPRAGGTYRMTLTYLDAEHGPGKSAENADVVQGRFVELVLDTRVVQAVVFDSEDPAFAGEMKMTWALRSVPDGTEVRIVCENVPEGIRQEDHDAGLRSTLENLARFTEGR